MKNRTAVRGYEGALKIWTGCIVSLLLLSGLALGQTPNIHSAVVGEPFAEDTKLLPNVWSWSLATAVDGYHGDPQFFQLFLRVAGSDSVPGLPSLAVLVETKVKKEGCRWATQIDPATGDTAWTIEVADGIADTGMFSIPLEVYSGDSLRIGILNAGDTVLVRADSTFHWRKH